MVEEKVALAFTDSDLGFIQDLIDGKVDRGWEPNLRRQMKVEAQISQGREVLALRGKVKDIERQLGKLAP